MPSATTHWYLDPKHPPWTPRVYWLLKLVSLFMRLAIVASVVLVWTRTEWPLWVRIAGTGLLWLLDPLDTPPIFQRYSTYREQYRLAKEASWIESLRSGGSE
jgi:hypothetical protein